MPLIEPEGSVKVFISYAHADQELHKNLEEHLSPLKHSGKITIWQDQEIPPGANWQDQIDMHLNEADIILLLVSASFIASKYCWNKEVQAALERHKAGSVKVIPIILKPTHWEDTPLGQLQVLPTGAKPVTQWNDQDAAFDNVVRGIQAVVKELRIKKSLASAPIVQAPPPILAPKLPVFSRAILKKLLSSFPQKIRFSIKSPLFVGISLTLVIIIILLSIFRSQIVDHILFPPTAPTPAVPPKISKGIGVTLVNNEYIGISDGRYALDTNPDRQGRNLKIQACADLLAGNTSGAESLWFSDLQEDSNDAETLIYLEDQRVLASDAPYITLVVGVLLGTNTFNAYSRDYLQSAYVAQKEYNDGNDGQKLPGGVKVRLLIAKSGSDPQQSVRIAQQVVEAAKFDPTIVGVMGWETSPTSVDVLPILSQAHIPLVAGGAATDQLTMTSPYFFRVGPPNEVTGGLLAQYIQTKLQPRNIVLFEDPSDSYSQSLARAFVAYYPLAPIVQFQTGGSTAILTKSVQHALQQYTPDLIVFTSNDMSDMTAVLNIIADTPQYTQVKVAMGIAAYEVAEANKPFKGYDHLLFASAASPDEWILFSSQQQPNFFKDYADDFDPQRQHVSSPYSYLRADSFTMLGYDAMLALLQGSQILLEQGKIHFKPDELRQALTQINLAGVSGGIVFGQDGNPVNKIHFVLSVDAQNHLQISAYQGCFALTPSCDPNKIVMTGKP